MTDLTPSGWNEDSSLVFLKYGDYFVPGREEQLRILCELVGAAPDPQFVVDLCSGAGLLSEAILAKFPGCKVIGLDGSQAMLNVSAHRLKSFAGRFQAQAFNLSDAGWRQNFTGVDAIVSSLAIHHLDAFQKQQLFRDCFQMLNPGGVLAIADLIDPITPTGKEISARAWDEAVRERRAIQRDGNDSMYLEFQNLGWNIFRYPDEMDKPSGLFEMLTWLQAAGFVNLDVFWQQAGHAVFAGQKQT